MTMTKSQKVAQELAADFQARNALTWIVSSERVRVERYLKAAAEAAGCVARTWDCAKGICKMTGESDFAESGDLTFVLSTIDSRARGIAKARYSDPDVDQCVWILRNADKWLTGPLGIENLQNLQNLALFLPTVPSAQSIVILTTSAEVPPELKNDATVINWPIPDRAEVEQCLERTLKNNKLELENGARQAVIDAALGITYTQAESCFSKSIVLRKTVDSTLVTEQKKLIMKGQGLVQWLEPLTGGLAAVGGLDNVKEFLLERQRAYSPAGRAYGLPSQKGIFLGGIPGCGKTLIAAALAGELGIPYVKLDLGSQMGPLVGQSQGRIRQVLEILDTIGRCVCLLDEADKQFKGATGAAGDGGVAADQLSTFLQWQNDRTSDVFLVMTANDVSVLPPELTRQGRFDEFFFVDLPSWTERVAILQATLRKFKREKLAVDLNKVATDCDGFSGAEVAALVPAAMFRAYAENREIVTDDLLAARKKTNPQSRSSATSEKIRALKAWGANVTQASRPESNVMTPTEFGDSRILRPIA